MSKKFKDMVILATLCGIGVMLILKQEAVSQAITESVKTCVYRIIPSLFAMSVISTAISRSGTVSLLLRSAHVNTSILTAFIFGNVGGYPIGAELLAEAVESGSVTKDEAASAVCFCYGCGPAFAAGVVGAAVFGDVRYGLAALGAVILSNTTMFAAYLLKHKSLSSNSALQHSGFSTKLMIDSINSATGAMTGICSMILFFSALRAVLEAYFPKLSELKYSGAILEISNISVLSPRQGISLVTAAVLLGFGGICVNMQLLSVINGRFSLKRFYLLRPISLMLTAGYAYLLEKLLTRFGIVSAATKIRLSQSPSLIPILCVAAMVFITLNEQSKLSR